MVKKYISKKLYTPEWIADNLDAFLTGVTSLSNMSTGTVV